jgi:parallel beta-helix repeat protein
MPTYYVNVNTGSNTNNGLSQSAPFQTLQKGADTAVAGDTVIIASGTYTEGMNLYGKTGGTQSSPITFSAQSGVVVTHCATSGPNASLAAINVENTGGNYIFDNFKIVSDGSMQRAGIRINNSNNCTVRNCEVNSAFIGVFFSSTSGTIVENSHLYNSTDQHGVYCGGNSRAYIVRGNNIHNNNWDGIHTNSSNGNPNDNGLIERNIIYNNNLSGMDVEGTTNAIIRNNIISGNGKHGIVFHYQDQPNTPVCENNSVINNTILSSNNFCILMSEGSDNQTILNNILYHTNPGTYGVLGCATATPRVKSNYNSVLNNFSFNKGVSHVDFATWKANTGQDLNSIILDLVSQVRDFASGDYYPVDGSQLIDSGGAMSGHAPPSTDFNGSNRPQGSTYDIGAFEYVTGTSTPTDPTNLVATQANPYSIILTWFQAGSNENWSEIERSLDGGSTWTFWAQIDPTIRTYTDTGLTIGQPYTYRVRSVNWVGASNWSDSVTQTGPNSPLAPASPSSLSVSSSRYDTVTLSWTDNATTETNYHVERASGYNGSFSEIAVLSTNSTSYIDINLNPSTQYRYRVRAENATVYSGYSNEASIITSKILTGTYSLFNTSTDVPDIENDGPDNLLAINVGIKFKVTVPTTVTALRFYKGSSNTGTHIMRIWAPGDSLVADITFDSETASGWQEKALPTPASLSPNVEYVLSLYSPTGVYSLTSNYFTSTKISGPIKVESSNGVFLYSDIGNAWNPNNVSPTNANYWVDLVVNPDSILPDGPSDLSVTPGGISATLTWTDNSLNEDGFSIERSINGGTFNQIATVGYGQTRFTNTLLNLSLVYRYRVRAYNDNGFSGYTNTVLVGSTAVPEVPTNLTAIAGVAKVTLEWDINIDNTTKYLIYRSTDDITYSLVYTALGITTSSWIDRDVVGNTTYYYKISAKDSATTPNESDKSASVSATPSPVPSFVSRGSIKFSDITIINGVQYDQ